MSQEICSVMYQNLTFQDIFLVLGRLNRNFAKIVDNLKIFDVLWKQKFCDEFICARDRNSQKYNNNKQEFISMYAPNIQNKSWFEVFKMSALNQKSMFSFVK